MRMTDETLSAPHDHVLGLEDVALGRTVCYPMTIYLLRNNDRSGVMGILKEDNEFISKRKSTTGTIIEGRDDDYQPFEAVVVWDGACPSPLSAIPLGVQGSGDTVKHIFRESSKGILLGEYPNTGALWAGIAAGRAMC